MVSDELYISNDIDNILLRILLGVFCQISTELLPLVTNKNCLRLIFMPPTSKKLEGHIASAAFVRPFVTLIDA